MKYYTPARHLALQDFSSDEIMDAAYAAWEEEVARYDAYLQTIRPTLPETLRVLLDGYYLNDANVLGMGRKDGCFEVVLQLDAPPNELLTIAYDLRAEPTLDKNAFDAGANRRILWLYDELKATAECFTHSILFSNGWTLDIAFKDVTLTASTAIFPEREQEVA